MTQGVYEIENGLNGKAYTGNSADVERRRGEHLRMLRNNRHHCEHLQSAWNLYGEEAFEFVVLEVIEDPVERLATEQERINERRAAGTSYNAALDVVAPMLGRTHTEAARHKMSVSRMGNQNSLGRALSDATKQKIGDANRGRVVSAATRQKQSVSRMGNQYALGHRLTEEQKREIGERMMGNQYAKGSGNTDKQRRENSERMMGNQYTLGYKHTDTTKQKMSAAKMGNQNSLGYKHTDATRLNMSKAGIGRKFTEEYKRKIATANAKPYPALIHRDTGEIVPAGRNLAQLCRERELNKGCMRLVKNGKQPHHRGWALLIE